MSCNKNVRTIQKFSRLFRRAGVDVHFTCADTHWSVCNAEMYIYGPDVMGFHGEYLGGGVDRKHAVWVGYLHEGVTYLMNSVISELNMNGYQLDEILAGASALYDE